MQNLVFWHDGVTTTCIYFDGKVHEIARASFGAIMESATQSTFNQMLRDAATKGRQSTVSFSMNLFTSTSALLARDQPMWGGGALQDSGEARLFSKGVGAQICHPLGGYANNRVGILAGSQRTHFEPELPLLFLPTDGLPAAVTLGIDIGAEDVTRDIFDPEAKGYTGAMATLPFWIAYDDPDGKFPLESSAQITMCFERSGGDSPTVSTQKSVGDYLSTAPSIKNAGARVRTGQRMMRTFSHPEGVLLTPGKAGVARTDDDGIQVGDEIVVGVTGLPELRMPIRSIE